MKSSNRLPPEHFLYLAESRYEDEKQSLYLALLDAAPQSKAEAQAIIKKAHYSHEREWRKYRRHNLQLDHDPPAPQYDEQSGQITEALDMLPDDDSEIVRMHVLDRISLRDIADALNVSRETLRRRYQKIICSLRAELTSKVGQNASEFA